MRTEDSLLPCPFCGYKARICGDYTYKMYYVACTNPVCGCAIGECYDAYGNANHRFSTEKEAAVVWNKRVKQTT